MPLGTPLIRKLYQKLNKNNKCRNINLLSIRVYSVKVQLRDRLTLGQLLLPRKPCPFDISRFSERSDPTSTRILNPIRSTPPYEEASTQIRCLFTRMSILDISGVSVIYLAPSIFRASILDG